MGSSAKIRYRRKRRYELHLRSVEAQLRRAPRFATRKERRHHAFMKELFTFTDNGWEPSELVVFPVRQAPYCPICPAGMKVTA